MNRDSPYGSRPPSANQPPVEVHGEFFYQNPNGRNGQQVVLSREPGRYPPGHEAPMRPVAAQQVMLHQQPLPMVPQQDYMAPPMIHQQFMQPPMVPQQQFNAPPMMQRPGSAPPMNQQQQFCAPPMNQQQFMHPPMVPQQQFNAPPMMQRPGSAPPMNQHLQFNGPPMMQQPGFMGPLMPPPPNVVTMQQPLMMPPPPQPSIMPPWDVMDAQPIQHQYQGGYQPNNVGSPTLVDPPPRVPLIYRPKLFPGDQIILDTSMIYQAQVGPVELLANPNNLMVLVCSGTAATVPPEERNVAQETESTERQQVQMEKQDAIQQEPVQQEKALLLKTPEEPAPQPTEQRSTEEELVEQPPNVDSNQPLVDLLNKDDNNGQKAEQSSVEMADQPKAEQQVAAGSAQTSTQQLAEQEQVQESAPKIANASEKTQQVRSDVTQQPEQPALINSTPTSTHQLAEQKQVQQSAPKVATPSGKTQQVHSDGTQEPQEPQQPALISLTQTSTQQLVEQEQVQENAKVATPSGKTRQLYSDVAQKPQQPQQPALMSSTKTCIQQLPKQKQIHNIAPKVASQSERPRQSHVQMTHKPSPPMMKPQADSWTKVGPSSASSSKQAKEVVYFKAPAPKPKSIDEKKEFAQEKDQAPPAEEPKETGCSSKRKKKNKKPGKPTQSKAEKEAQEREDSEAIDAALVDVQEVRALTTSFNNYYQNHMFVRGIIVAQDLQANCVETSDFERSLLTYHLKIRNTDWNSRTDDAKKFLKKSKDARKKSKSPRDKELVQKYTFLLDNLAYISLQDVLAIIDLYPATTTQTLENEYFGLLYNPNRTDLVVNPTVNDHLPAPRDDQLKSCDEGITAYVKHQNSIRAEGNLAAGDKRKIMEYRLLADYVEMKSDFEAKLANDRKSLVETYYRFWNWQHRRMKVNLSERLESCLQLNCAKSMASRDVSDPVNDVLLFDAQFLVQEQKGLFSEECPLGQLTENTKLYMESLFFSQIITL